MFNIDIDHNEIDPNTMKIDYVTHLNHLDGSCIDEAANNQDQWIDEL